MSTTETIPNAIVGVTADACNTVPADSYSAHSFDVYTRHYDPDGVANAPTLNDWVANYATLEEAIAANPDAEVLNG